MRLPGWITAGIVVLAAATVAIAEPVVLRADVRRTKTGVTATVRGTADAADWPWPADVRVGLGSASATVAPSAVRDVAIVVHGARADVVASLRHDRRTGRFTVRCRSAATADYADPIAFVVGPDPSWQFEIPLRADRRRTRFRGELRPVTDPDGGGGGGPGPDPEPAAPRVVGYFTAWSVYGRGFRVKDLETSGAADRLTHINYAFANLDASHHVVLGDAWADIDRPHDAASSVDGTADTWDAGRLRGNFRQLLALKARHPGLRVLISVGGWTWSSRFSDAALTESSRAAFSESCVATFVRGEFAPGVTVPGVFDGIDVDWEYPGVPGNTNDYRPEDRENYVALLAKLRADLDAQGAADGRRYELTVAGAGGIASMTGTDVAAVAPLVDAVNLMTYDFHGAWDAVTNGAAPLRAAAGDPAAAQSTWADAAVQAWRAAGLPSSKLVLGVPFYGRGWSGVPPGPRGDGLWQTATGAAPSSPEAGVADFRVLSGLTTGWEPHRHAESGAFWIYEPTARVLWSYDDATAVRAKMDYVRSQSLAGAMVWSLDGDDDAGTLLRAVREGLDAAATKVPAGASGR